MGREPKRGSLEMLGQTSQLIWAENAREGSDFLALRREPLSLSPIVLATTSSSNMMEALEKTLPQLSHRSLEELAPFIPLILLDFIADLASSNVRMKMFIADWLINFNKRRVDAGEKDVFVVRPP